MEAVGHWLLFVCNLLGLEVLVGGESIGPFGTCTRLDLFFICVCCVLRDDRSARSIVVD